MTIIGLFGPQYVITNLLTNIKSSVFIVSNFDLHLTDKFDSLMALADFNFQSEKFAILVKVKV